jgi:phosphoribosylaminoimidazole-succinocarboxamide synthase
MICGLKMPAGMRKNDPFPEPISTPTTKASAGHDENISKGEILKRGLVSKAILEKAERYALDMFAYGQDLARSRGLILVDTKYEMGLTADGELIVIDEVHTPDSSRYWIAGSYDARLAAGVEPEGLDKEFVRRMIIDRGYDVDSNVDPAQFLTDQIRLAAADRYLELYTTMTGATPKVRSVNETEVLEILDDLSSNNQA